MLYWADQLIAEFDAEEVILNDSKTYSGSAHVGSLRGPVIHNVLYRAALDAGRKARFLYGSDDYDALDAIPPSLSEERYKPYLGKPLFSIPAPDDSDRSYAEYFYDEFLAVQHKLGIYPETYRMSDLYRSGQMNDVIRTVLENADEVRKIYFEISESQKGEDWLPFNTICEKCGCIAMTRVYKFDGEKVHYKCEPNAMDYASGCGHEGVVSPFDGKGKLPWKLEWAARWVVLGVNFEGAGMDHSVAGGSRDVAEAIIRRVFKQEPPANIPYEFLLLEGGKMSSSKGIGFTAHEVGMALPPEMLRYLLVRTRPKTAINFQMGGTSIPKLFDDFDAAWEQYFQESENEENDWSKRLFELAQIEHPAQITERYVPRFMHAVTVAQIPGIDALNHFTVHKGDALRPDEIEEIEKRLSYVKIWLDRFAPENAVVEVQAHLPKSARDLTEQQRALLVKLRQWFASETDLDGERIHKMIYDIATGDGMKPGQAFQAVYLTFLGRASGPRAGELLAALDPKFVVRRLQEVETAQYLADVNVHVLEKRRDAVYGDLLKLDAAVLERFPQLRIGVAVIRGVSVRQTDEELTALVEEVTAEIAAEYEGVNPNDLERVHAYREIYRAFGVNPNKQNPSSEALLRRVLRGRGIGNINTVVDAYNLSSVEAIIPMAAYDLNTLQLPVELRFAVEGDSLQPIGGGETEALTAGELVYADQARVICRDFNYRDSDVTKITLDTQDVLLLVDGCQVIDVDALQGLLDTAISRIIRFSGGELVRSAVIYQA
jgi:lysyl-tRNA synthetase class 1